jgi:hypothetical protein
VALGGDWNLEYKTGKNPATVIFNDAATSAYQNTLATLTVLNMADAGANSLRERIGAALAGDTIKFDPTLNGTAIALTSGEIAFGKSLTISGNGSTNTIIDGNANGRIFNITANAPVTIDGVTIKNGRVTGIGGGINTNGALTITNSSVSGNVSSSDGGGIESAGGSVTIINSTVLDNKSSGFGGGIDANGGLVTITNSTVSGNTSSSNGGGVWSSGDVVVTNSAVSNNKTTSSGGGIRNTATLTLTNSTLSGNTASNNGGGIFSNGATITNSTITNNTADVGNNGTGDGGGISRNGGTITIRNSIIAGNFDTPNNAGTGAINPDVSGTFVDGGNNLIGDSTGSANFTVSTLVGTAASRLNPQLAPLANYGGTTQTHALLPNSPALNAGNNANAPVGNDQRGATRIIDSAVDIGSFESQGFSLTPLANTTPQSTNINTSFAQLLGVQVTEDFVNAPIPAPNILVTFTPSSSANGLFTGITSILTNNLGIALAPTFTANGIPGSYTVAATANGFKPASFSLTNKVAGGFGGVFPSREDLEGRTPRLNEQDLEMSFTKVLCLDPSLATAQTSSIPTCKK